MATTTLSPEQEEYLAYIVSSAEQLKHVISDILDFKQLGTELTIEKQPVSIRECLNEALLQSGIVILSGSGTGVTCHVADNVPDYIMSDRSRIVQVLVNLIHNAMRFSTRDSWSLLIEIENMALFPPSPSNTPPLPHTSLPLSPSSVPIASTPTLTSTSTSTSTSTLMSALPSISASSSSSLPLPISPSPISPTTSPPSIILPDPSSTPVTIEPSTSSPTNLLIIPPLSLPSTSSLIPSVSPTNIPLLKLPHFFPPSTPAPVSFTSPVLSPRTVKYVKMHDFATQHAHAHAHAYAAPHTSSDALQCVISITIRDKGIGIDPVAMPNVFDADNSLSRIKHVLELLGGDIKIESEGQHKGTTVIVTLKAEIWAPPLTPSNSPSIPSSSSHASISTFSSPSLSSSSTPIPSLFFLPSSSPSLSSTSFTSLASARAFQYAKLHPLPFPIPLQTSSPTSSPSSPLSSSSSSSSSSSPTYTTKPKLTPGFKDLNVLLVEDNLMNQKVLRRLFGKLGITPDVASHGAQAVEYVQGKKYDIVFMDLHMPVCDGFEATKQIQKLPQVIHKPHIYALTASVSSEDKDMCMKVGMKGHLSKPVSVQSLVDALSSVCI